MNSPRTKLAVVWFGALLLAPFIPAAESSAPLQERADHFLEVVNATFQALTRVQQDAQWLAATDVTSAHDAASEVASKALAAFTGNPALIREAKALLAQREKLKPITFRQLDRVMLNAAEGPMTNPELKEPIIN